MENLVKEIIDNWNKDEVFSGVLSLTGTEGVIYQKAFGY